MAQDHRKFQIVFAYSWSIVLFFSSIFSSVSGLFCSVDGQGFCNAYVGAMPKLDGKERDQEQDVNAKAPVSFRLWSCRSGLHLSSCGGQYQDWASSPKEEELRKKGLLWPLNIQPRRPPDDSSNLCPPKTFAI